MKKVHVTVQTSINSDGLWYPSISIYYSGCDKKVKCPDCHNKELQKLNQGFEITTPELITEVERQLVDWLDIYDKMAICYIGGEPLAEWNRDSAYETSKYFKEKYNDKIVNIIYSWRYIEDIKEIENHLNYMDYGVLGDFQMKNKDLNFIPSSTNQYIYDFNKKQKLKPIRKGV